MLYIQPCANGNLLSLQRKNQFGQEMHNIRYTYPNGNNRLGSISSTGISSSAYKYDALGNLVHDNAEDLTVSWNALGKVDTIRRNGNTLSSFRYSPTGQRQVKTDSSGVTFYIHDATGNVMCIYRQNGDTLRATERYLYGSKRLGVLEQQIWITANSIGLQDSNTIGVRVYEFTDHLGNVTYTAQDRKWLVQDSYGQWQFIPFAVTYTDYYPFGFPMPGRSFDKGGYRYFFNGQEADNEAYGQGSLAGYEFREYDTRLGRWWGVDPMVRSFPGESPYAFCYGNPIIAKDCNGGYGVIVIHQQRDENGDVIGGTATLVMTFYYNSAENFEGPGKISAEQALVIQRNIQSNLNVLYQEDIVIDGITYKFDYEIDFVDLASPNQQHKFPYSVAKYDTYKETGIRKGNYLEASKLTTEGDKGQGSQYYIMIDFEKWYHYIQLGWADIQTPTHEFLHTIGAVDTEIHGGTRMMDYTDPNYGIPVPMRWIMMEDIENLFYDGNDRLHIIYENE
ncbi:MAG: hypothetical protein II838_14910 [Lachnospiraceae bacterium]|nr:hypothetical protein [Lachnospiraceae bacterium]